MSQSTGPVGDAPLTPRGAGHEVRRRGSIFGIGYDFGLRMVALSEAEPGPSSVRPLQEARPLALPSAAQPGQAPVAEEIERWESEGGAVS